MINVDGDALVFIAGFAADSRNGALSHSIYNMKLMLDLMVKNCKDDNYKILLSSTNKKDNWRYDLFPDYKIDRGKICQVCFDRWLELLKVNEFKDYVNEKGVMELKRDYLRDGSGKFSDTTIIRTVEKFKRRYYTCLKCGEFVASKKPTYFKKMRQYLINYKNAQVVKGEADDFLLLNSPEYVATHDKDIYQGAYSSRKSPCILYNFKDESFTVCTDPGDVWLDEKPVKCPLTKRPIINKNGKPRVKKELKGYGYKWFCALMLMGDAADSIPKPFSGDGDVYFYTILNQLTTKLESWKMVEYYYRTSKNSYILERNAKLFWVPRKKGQIWSREMNEELINE